MTPETTQVMRLLLAAEGIDFDELLASHQQRQAQGRVGTKDCWLTLQEAMAYSRMSRSSIWRLIRDHRQLKVIKLSPARSGRVLISRLSLEALLESKCIKRESV